jgi:hypothetical protein
MTQVANRVAILQSCYIPWRGYFDLIGMSDIFVVYDDVQYRKNHWHNRNRIRDAHGTPWLTMPVSLPRGLNTKIEEVNIDPVSLERHWRTISQCYASAKYFREYAGIIGAMYKEASTLNTLSRVNVYFLKNLVQLLGLKAQFLLSSDLCVDGDKTGRLVSICQSLGADRYLSGPAARSYLDTKRFEAVGIGVEWMDYFDYRPYPQMWPGFEPFTSIIDLIFNTGADARSFMKC